MWRCSSQILKGHSICPFDLHQLVEQCLIHYDDNTNVWLMFWPHTLTSTQPCSIIQIMCRCKHDKANTNTCHVMWLVRVVLFKDCPASLIVIFTLPLKSKAMFCTNALATDPFSSTFMNCWFNIDFEEAFIRNLSNQKKKYCIGCGTCIKHQLRDLYEDFGLLMILNSAVQHVAWEIFSPSRFEKCISIL